MSEFLFCSTEMSTKIHFSKIFYWPKMSRPVILDVGSQSTKSGFSGDKFPISIKNTKKETFSAGIISNMEEFENTLNFIFTSELKVKPEEQSVLLSESPTNPRIIRENLTQLMFENFNVPSYYLVPSTLLSMYSIGLNTGTIIESGLDVTHVFSCHEGYGVKDCFNCVPLAGNNITNQLMKKLEISEELTNSLKENVCFIKNGEEKIQNDYVYKLPMGVPLLWEMKYLNLQKFFSKKTPIVFHSLKKFSKSSIDVQQN
jgi:actin-related protein